MSTCQLCLEEAKLIGAHIIPKWAFKYLYPDDPEEKKQPLLLVDKTGTKRRPIGPYDSGLLCKRCDQFLGMYDSYGKEILLDKPLHKANGELTYILEDVDTDRLRIFLLSVAWRASISKREEFERVEIGPYKEKIRCILNSLRQGIPVESDDYSFVITKFDEGQLPNDVVNKVIQVPHSQKIGGINVVVLYMPRCLKIYIKIDKRIFEGTLKKFATFSKDKILVGRMGPFAFSDEFKALWDIA